MTFSPCTEFWGSSVLLPGEPEILECREVIYRPFSKEHYFTNYPGWGITDIDGRLIMATAYTRGPHDELVGQAAEHTPLARSALNRAPDETYIYGGQLIPHYGHFLLSSLARFWPVNRHEFAHLKILLHSDYTVEEMMRIPYIDALLKATKIDLDRMVTFPTDTIIEKLIVPFPSFIEQKQSHALFRATSAAIGRTLMGDHRPAAKGRPIYISKTRLTSGVARFTNEWVVEDVLRSHGVEIVFPETLSLPDQVRLFASHDIITGSATSAFHSHILVENQPKILSINSKNAVNTNFLILDGLKNVEASYMYEPHCRETDGGAFMLSYTLNDPVSYATSILDWIETLPDTTVGGAYLTPRERHPHPNILPDLEGPSCEAVMQDIHLERHPESYLEIGDFPSTFHELADCDAVLVGPDVSVSKGIRRTHNRLALFKEESKDFFAHGPDLKSLLRNDVALALLNGNHRADQLIADFAQVEKCCRRGSLIILHDCIPVELAMTDGVPNVALGLPHRAGWWIGDLWRVPLVLKAFRPDLEIAVIPARPAGLVLVRNLDPGSQVLVEHKNEVDELMRSYDLATMTIASFHAAMELEGCGDRVIG